MIDVIDLTLNIIRKQNLEVAVEMKNYRHISIVNKTSDLKLNLLCFFPFLAKN